MTQDFFFGLIGFLLGAILLGMVVYGVLKKYSISPGIADDYPIREIFGWVRKDVGVKKRFLITLGVLLLIGVASFIPLPGVNLDEILRIFRELNEVVGGSRLNRVFNDVDGFQSGALSQVTILSLGFMPFFTACILLQIASAFIPALKRYAFGGEHGRSALADHTYPLTILVSLIWAYFVSLQIERVIPAKFHVQILIIHGWSFRLLAMVTLTSGVGLLLFLAGIITRYGLGNGVAVIVVADFPVRFIAAARDAVVLAENEMLPVHGAFLIILIVILFVSLSWGIYVITSRVTPIGLQDKNEKRITVHLRSSLVGRMPIALGIALLYLLISLTQFTHINWLRVVMLNPIALNTIYAILILTFTYLYALLIFDSRYVAELAQRYGYSLVEAQGNTVASHLRADLLKLLAITGLFLVGGAVVPDLIKSFLKAPPRMARLIGGVEVFVVIGVLLDIVKQLVFLKNKQESGLTDWAVCYTAFDDIEATIKSEYLKSRGIPVLVEPLRFTWGMPMRTIVDQYRIYVPLGRAEEARKSIL